MTQREQLLGPSGPSPRFATVFRGYDREQVDSWLREHERQMADSAGSVGDSDRRATAPEPRSPDRELDSSHRQLQESLAACVLDRAREVARQLPERVIREAEEERRVLQQTATELIETARARSAQIVGAARRDRREAAPTADEVRRQIDLLRKEASDRAREGVRRRWVDTTIPLSDVELELAGLRARRQILVTELAQLERSVRESRAHLREHDANEVEAPSRPDLSETAPARRPWALMPIEW